MRALTIGETVEWWDVNRHVWTPMRVDAISSEGHLRLEDLHGGVVRVRLCEEAHGDHPATWRRLPAPARPASRTCESTGRGVRCDKPGAFCVATGHPIQWTICQDCLDAHRRTYPYEFDGLTPLPAEAEAAPAPAPADDVTPDAPLPAPNFAAMARSVCPAIIPNDDSREPEFGHPKLGCSGCLDIEEFGRAQYLAGLAAAGDLAARRGDAHQADAETTKDRDQVPYLCAASDEADHLAEEILDLADDVMKGMADRG